MLVIREEQYKAFAQYVIKGFEDRVVIHLKQVGRMIANEWGNVDCGKQFRRVLRVAKNTGSRRNITWSASSI